MKNSVKILVGLALAVIGSQAQALLITPSTIGGVACDYTDPTVAATTCWKGSTPNNPDAANVSTITGVSDLVELYKADVGDSSDPATVESGSFASSYETTFSNTELDPEDALIKYEAGKDTISCPECFLLVKDGKNDPIWYIFDIGSWNGTDDLDIDDFWVSNGGISHVAIYSNNVPEPGMVGLLGIGLIGVVVVRRRMKV